MNKTLAISAIALIAVIMVTGSIAPVMAEKGNNNGKAMGCEKANENSKVGEKNPNCEKFDLCEAIGVPLVSKKQILLFIIANDSNVNGTLDKSEFPGSDALFDEIDVTADGQLELLEILKYYLAHCV